MTVSPRVELLFHPTDLNPADLARSGQFLGSPTQAIEAGLGAVRLMMVDRMKHEIAATTGDVSVAKLVDIADLAWQGAFWRFRRISAPVMADAYIRAYRTADAGDVPMSLIYDLADKHADRIGEYFHTSSKQAMVEGFNSYVNRRMASRAAADRILDAYGLTSRQIGGYTSATNALEGKITSRERRSLKARVIDYVGRSFRRRIKKFAQQEEHNIDQQAQQFAWMWLQDKGRLGAEAEKVWITAKDEKVCKICGPLHGQRVLVSEQFHSDRGDFWTPGVHPNCRCTVRLLENKFTVTKALSGGQLQQFNRRHPRDREGQFADIPDQPRVSTRPNLVDPEWLKKVEAELAAQQKEQEEADAWETSDWSDDWSNGWSDDWSSEPTSERKVRVRIKRKKKPAPQTTPQVTSQELPERVDTYGTWSQDSWSPESWSEENWSTALQEQNPALTVEQMALNSMAFDRAVKEVTEQPRERVYERATVPVPGSPGSGENLVYRYDPLSQVTEPEGVVTFGEDEEWAKGTQGGAQIKARAQARVNAEIQDTYDLALINPDNEYSPDYNLVSIRVSAKALGEATGEKIPGNTVLVAVTPEELHEMLHATAYKAEQPDLPGRVVSNPARPEQMVGYIPADSGAAIMSAMGIKPEQFEQTIYVASEGYSPADTGYGLMEIEHDTGHSYDTYVNPGKFETRDESTRVPNQGPYRIVNVDPMVEVRESPPVSLEDLKRTSPDWQRQGH